MYKKGSKNFEIRVKQCGMPYQDENTTETNITSNYIGNSFRLANEFWPIQALTLNILQLFRGVSLWTGDTYCVISFLFIKNCRSLQLTIFTVEYIFVRLLCFHNSSVIFLVFGVIHVVILDGGNEASSVRCSCSTFKSGMLR